MSNATLQHLHAALDGISVAKDPTGRSVPELLFPEYFLHPRQPNGDDFTSEYAKSIASDRAKLLSLPSQLLIASHSSSTNNKRNVSVRV